MNENYQRFRELYASQQGPILSDTLRELDSMEFDCSQPGMDEMRGNIYNLLSYEAVASLGPVDLLSARPRQYRADPRSQTDMRPELRENAIQWMDQNPDRWRAMRSRGEGLCFFGEIFPSGQLQIDMPSMLELRICFPENVTDHPRIEGFFNGWTRMADYIDNTLRHLVLDRTENNSGIWREAYRDGGMF